MVWIRCARAGDIRRLLLHAGPSVQTNQYHPFDPNETASFGFIFAVFGSAIIKFLIVDKILLKVAQKRSAIEIAKEIAKDVAITSVQIVAEGVIDAATGSSSVSSGSSSSGSTKGGEGKFGGGGASGNY